MKRITIKEIAKTAGVSVGTVDRVLHNRGEVAQVTRDLVLKIAEEGNYTTNVFARTLKLNKTFQLATVIPQDNEYWMTIRKGIELATWEYESLGIEIKFYKFERSSKQTFVDQSNLALEAKPDGVILAPLLEQDAKDICNEFYKQSIPFVLVDSNLTGVKPLAFVGQDTVQSGVLSAKLLNYGYPNGHIAWILKYSDYDIWNKTVEERIRGFRNFYALMGWPNDSIREVDLIDQHSLSIMNESIKLDTPIHIFIPNSRAHQVINWLEQIELKQNTRVVGYDQISSNVEALRSGQVDFIINQNPLRQGYLAVQALYRHLVMNTSVQTLQYMPIEIVTKENVDFANLAWG